MLKHFAFETEIRTPGAEYDARSDIRVFLTVSEPRLSFGKFDRKSSFVLKAFAFPDEGDEMTTYCRGMLSLVEDGQAVFLNLEDSTQPEDEQYRSRFYTHIWHYLENCARRFFPDAHEFCVDTEMYAGSPENWQAFRAKFGYWQDDYDGFSRKPAVPTRNIQLPKPHVIKKSAEAV